MSAAKHKILHSLFEHWDVDNSGGLDKDEIKSLMAVFQPDDTTKRLSKKQKKKGRQQAKLKVSEAQLQRTFKLFDANKDGVVSENEFKDFFLLSLQHKYNSFDVDGDGAIESNEFGKFVSAFYSDLGSKEKERKQKRLMKDQDKDGDNKVTLEEFETWVLEEIQESLDKNKSLPLGMRKLVDMNVAHMEVEGPHKEGITRALQEASATVDKEETVIAVAAAKPARPPRPPPTLLGQIKCIDVIKYVSKFSMCLLFPSRLKGDKGNFLNQILAMIWPFGDGEHKGGGWQVVTMFLLGAFRTFLMDRSAGMSRTLISTVFKQDRVAFSDLIRSVMVLSGLTSLCNAWYRYAEEMLAVEWRGKLTSVVHQHYFAQSNYYHVQHLKKTDRRTGQQMPMFDNPDSQITNEIKSVSNRLVLLVSRYALALPSLGWFTYKLYKARGGMYAFMPQMYFLLAYEVAQRLFPKDKRILYMKLVAADTEYSAAASRLQSHAESVVALGGTECEAGIMAKKFDQTHKAGSNLMWSSCKFDFIFKLAYLSGSRCWMPWFVLLKGLASEAAATTAVAALEVSDARKTFAVLLEQCIATGKLLDAHANDMMGQGQGKRLFDLISQLRKMETDRAKFKSDTIIPGDGDTIRFDKVKVVTPLGNTLVNELSWELKKPDSMLLTGHNGAGKSSIFRCLGGLWSIPEGVIVKPGAGSPAFENLKNIFYVPQKPYLTLGSLKGQITYPLDPDSPECVFTDAEMNKLLDLVQLGHLKERAAEQPKDELQSWESMLSRGEQQCLAIARLFFHEPKFAILDECTSAVSREMEQLLYHECMRRGISYITICHRPALKAFHDRNLNLTGMPRLAADMIEIPDDIRQKHPPVVSSSALPAKSESTVHSFAEERKDAALSLCQASSQASPSSAQQEASAPLLGAKGAQKVVPSRSTFSKLKLMLSVMLPGSVSAIATLIATIGLRTVCAEAASMVMGKLFATMLRRDRAQFATFAVVNAAIVIVEGIADEAIGYLQSSISLRWCKTLSKYLRERLFKGDIFYRLTYIDKRITDSDDRLTKEITELSTEFSELWAKCITPAVDVVWFSLRLSSLVGAANMGPFFAYVAATSFIVKVCLPDFDSLNTEEKKLEARFRFVHRRLREHSESIAFFGGDAMEAGIADRTSTQLLDQMRGARLRNAQFRFAAHTLSKDFDSYSNVVGPADLVCAWMQMGMQGSGSEDFAANAEYVRTIADRTMGAYSKVFSLYEIFSSMLGSATRVCELLDVVATLQQEATDTSRQARPEDGDKIEMRNVSIMTPGDGDDANTSCLVHDLSLSVEKGKSLMVTGRNGVGKSSLFRVLAGLWTLPEGSGCTVCPSKVMLVPQRPYFVSGSLLDQVRYPDLKGERDEARAFHALQQAGIEYLVERHTSYKDPKTKTGEISGWDAIKNWQDILSGGETQRMGIARVFYSKPPFAILDECTDAVNVEAETLLYQRLNEANITCVTISKRLALEEYHPMELRLGMPTLSGWELVDVSSRAAGKGED